MPKQVKEVGIFSQLREQKAGNPPFWVEILNAKKQVEMMGAMYDMLYHCGDIAVQRLYILG